MILKSYCTLVFCSFLLNLTLVSLMVSVASKISLFTNFSASSVSFFSSFGGCGVLSTFFGSFFISGLTPTSASVFFIAFLGFSLFEVDSMPVISSMVLPLTQTKSFDENLSPFNFTIREDAKFSGFSALMTFS